MAPREVPQKSIFGTQKWYFPDFPFRGSVGGRPVRNNIGMQLFCVQLEASCLQCSFFYLQLTSWAFVLTIGAFFTCNFRGQKLNTNIFFSNFSGAAGISRQNPGLSRPKSLIFLVSRDIPNFLAPTPSRGRPLPHWKLSRSKSLGLGSFSFPEF